jgi:hypothetical protein
MTQCLLGQVLIAEPGVALESAVDVVTAGEVMGLEDIGDTAVEALHHGVGLGGFWAA